MMKRKIKIGLNWGLTGVLILTIGFSARAQKEGKKFQKESQSYTSKAERAKQNGNFASAEADYRKAVSRNPKNDKANYNFGNLYFDNKKELESFKHHLKASKSASKDMKHQAFHNLGNGYMKRKDYSQAVKAYEDALRNDPTDDKTRYNLAIAKEKLKKQQNQHKNDKNKKNKNKDDKNKKDKNQGKDNDEQKDKKKKDKGDKSDKKNNKKNKNKKGKDKDKDKDNQGKDKKKNKKPKNNEDKKNQKPKNNKGKGDQKGKPDEKKVPKSKAEKLLRAMEKHEKKVQKKRRARKEKAPKKDHEKDW